MNRNVPQVTVVIPTYNRAEIVGRAVAAVLAQSDVNLELIVVDDGSTDDTRARIAAIEDDRLRYVSSAKVGAAEARNVGARYGQAPWLTFLDSDDTVVTDWLTSLLAETGQAGTALVSCGYTERVDGDDVVLRAPLPRRASPSVGPIVELIETGGSYLVDRALFLEIGGFDPEQPAGQHQELALRLGPALTERRLRASAVMRPLVERWIGRGDNIRADDAAVLAGTLRILERHHDRLALDPRLLSNTAATAAHRALRLGRFSDARRLASSAVRAHPTNLRHWARLGLLIAPRAARRRALRATTAPAAAGGGPCDRASSP